MWGRKLALALCCMAWLASSPTGGAAQPARAAGAQTEARDLFWQGATAYREGHYEEALVAFEGAYALEALPEILFNIGQCHDRLRHDEQALDAFRRFAEQAPSSDERERALERIRVLEQALADRAAAQPVPAQPEPATPPPPRDSPESGGRGALPWIVIGGSAAVAIGGTVLLVLGQSDNASVEDASGPVVWSDYEAAYDRGPVLSNVGIAMIGAGLVGAAIGVVLFASGGSDEDRTAGVELSVRLGELQLGGTF